MILLKKYEVSVWEDGSITSRELPIEDVQLPSQSDECTSSMEQLEEITVKIMEYRRDHPNDNIHFAVANAINRCAAERGVTPSSIHAKCTRFLGIYMKEFKVQLVDYIEHKNDDFAITLESKLDGKYTKKGDREAVQRILKTLRD